MTYSLLDNPIKKPPRTLWVIVAILITLTGLGLLFAYPKIFPDSTTELATFNVKEAPSFFKAEADESVIEDRQLPSLVKYNDSISGFSLEAPPEWQIASNTGVISARSDSCGTNTAAFFPVKLTNLNFEPKQLLNDFGQIITSTFESNGGAFNLGEINDENKGIATAIFTGQACNNQIRGSLSASVSENKGLVRMSWAPQSDFEQLDLTLKEIIKSYRLTGSADFLKLSGSKIEIASPENWTIIENEQTIIAELNDKRVLVTALPLEADDSPELAIDNILQLEQDAGYEMSDLQIVSNKTETGTQADNQSWIATYRIIEFTNSNQKYRAGLTSATYSNLNGALISWKQAPVDEFSEQSLRFASMEQGTRLLPDNGLIEDTDSTYQLPIIFSVEEESVLTKLALAKKLTSADWLNIVLGYDRVINQNEEFLAPRSSQLPSGIYKRSDGQLFEAK
ncbi:hypothetical protein KC644_02345 [Candidatus Berkelbacteria bacterium]|nr:hypothetical protein [Candidatus Berkelbacteria bacterium]